MFGLNKKIFIGLLINIVNTSNHTKCISLSNKKYQIQPTFINLNPNEYSQWFQYYPFAVNLNKHVGSCNTLSDLYKKVCILNKTECLNLSVFNIIARINESKTLTKHISWKCQCRFDERNCNSGQWWTNDKYRYEL